MALLDFPHTRTPIPMLIVLFSDLAPIPIANFLAHPGGPVSRFLTPIITYASGTSDLHRVAAISGYYFFAVYTLSTGISINGAIIGNPEGHRNGEPRIGKRHLKGFPHRLTALHDNLLEFFPAFVICAVLTLALPIYGAERQLFEKSLNFLVLHAFLKSCLYIPAYAAGFDTVRSLTHMLAVACLLALLWGIATGSPVTSDQCA